MSKFSKISGGEYPGPPPPPTSISLSGHNISTRCTQFKFGTTGLKCRQDDDEKNKKQWLPDLRGRSSGGGF